MRKKDLFVLSLVAVLMMLAVPASAAGRVEFRANGGDLGYPDPGPDPSSVVVGGNWNMRVAEGDVDFRLSYREMNLIPEVEGGAPAGSVDHFWMSMVEVYGVDVGTGGCWVYGRFNVDKLAWMPEGSNPPIRRVCNFLGYQDGWVHASSDGFELVAGPWHLVGSTTSLK